MRILQFRLHPRREQQCVRVSDSGKPILPLSPSHGLSTSTFYTKILEINVQWNIYKMLVYPMLMESAIMETASQNEGTDVIVEFFAAVRPLKYG